MTGNRNKRSSLCTAEELRTAAVIILGGGARGMCVALMLARRRLCTNDEPGQDRSSWSLQTTHEHLGFKWDVGLGGYLQSLPSPSSQNGLSARVQRLRQLADMIDAQSMAASRAPAAPDAKEQHE